MNMKKLFSLLVVMATLITFSSCSHGQRVLVSYFSATGTTQAVAQRLSEAIGADLYEIAPETAYTAADLDWRDSLSRSTIEMKDPSSRPALANPKADVRKYDVIFLGFPIWWYTAPRLIRSYLESADFAGKIIIPFATSGSSPIDQACRDLEVDYPEILWKAGRRLNDISDNEIKSWAEYMLSTCQTVNE